MSVIDGTARGFDLTSPHAVMARLAEIEADLAQIQNGFEQAAFDHFKQKRDWAVLFLRAATTSATVAERKAIADSELEDGEAEARYEATKAAVRVLETRASIGQSILRAQGRG